jgi:Pectinesterase
MPVAFTFVSVLFASSRSIPTNLSHLYSNTELMYSINLYLSLFFAFLFSGRTIYYGEYRCTGPGANMTSRAPFVHMLNDTEAAPFLSTSFIDGDDWLKPYSY